MHSFQRAPRWGQRLAQRLLQCHTSSIYTCESLAPNDSQAKHYTQKVKPCQTKGLAADWLKIINFSLQLEWMTQLFKLEQCFKS